jgi:hypothetical protein
VILYEALAKRNDSILNVVAMNDSDKIPFEKYIVKLKAADEIKRVLEEKQKQKQENIERTVRSVLLIQLLISSGKTCHSSVDAAGYS